MAFYLLRLFREEDAVSSLLIEYLNESHYHMALLVISACGKICLNSRPLTRSQT
ncbi:hypothetical protein L581_2698 [Serratia fonticola AU-AP2C]|nr:hypothetical protein L581_2698 [Serratia fonticola AU-AP2C]